MAGSPLDLRALTIFIEVARTRSMTLAAAKLGLTQSAVSQSIRKLEAELGVKLIEAGKRPIALTRAADLLEEHAGQLLSEAARLPHRLAEAVNDAPEELRIGMVDTFAGTAGPVLARDLMQSSRRLIMWSGLTPSLSTALLNKEVDVIMTSDPLDDVDGLERHRLWREPFIVLLPSAHATLVPPGSLEAIAARLPFIRYSARSHTGRQIERHLRRLNLSIPRRVEVDGSDALVRLVAAGAGWAISTPLCLLQGLPFAAGVAARPLPSPRLSRSIYLVCRSDGPLMLANQITDIATAALCNTCLPQLQRDYPELALLIQIGADSDTSQRSFRS